MQLIIVESPTKSKTLQGFLGKNYKVLSSFGHVRDLPTSVLGVDVEKNFQPKYVVPAKAKPKVKILKEETKKSDEVILASVDYNEPVLIEDKKNVINQYRVGEFIDRAIDENFNLEKFKVPAFDFKSHKVTFKNIKAVSRHPISEPLLEVSLDYGRRLKITASHSVFTKNKNGKIKEVAGKDLKVGDKLLVPTKLPSAYKTIKKIDLLKEIYFNKNLCQKVFVNSPAISQYQKEKVLAPKTGNFYQFQPRLIFSTGLIKNLRNEREKLGISQKALSEKVGCSQPQVCDWEQGNANPTLEFGKRYLSVLGYDLQALSQQEVQIAPSSIQVAIRNALENQWKDSRKSLTHTFQPLSRFTWEEIEKNFKNDAEIEISRHNHIHKIPRFIPINSDLMIFLGFFIAEGSYSQNAVKFSFGNKNIGGEKDNIETIKNISKKIFNHSPSDFFDRTSNSIVLSSSLISFLMKDVFKIMGHSYKKTIPWIVFNVPANLQFAFLKGLFLGDGSLGKENIVFNTVSENLAQGIRFVLLQNNILNGHTVCVPKRKNRKPMHFIAISGKTKLEATTQIWQDHYKSKSIENYLKNGSQNKKNFSLIVEQKEDLGLLKIKSIKTIAPSTNMVYDFSVEGENFICGDGGICAHNTDEDREGEAIAWHLSEVLKLENPKRIVFHEITKEAIEKSLEAPREINMNLVNAQQARRILDRLVGYKLSPFLWKKIMRGLSAGRVQSVAMRLICDRENEIKKFIPQEYWSITASFLRPTPPPQAEGWGGPREFLANLFAKDGKTIERLEIKNKQEAAKVLQELEGAKYVVENIEKKETVRNPQAPFTTSTLQQTAVSKLGYGAKRTMSIAQKLYEKGHITYHRTDSLNLSAQSQESAKQFIASSFGDNYWPGFTRKFKTKSKSAQEAHEAIRPTHPNNTPDSLKKPIKLTPDELKLYTLIWQRFIASQMAPAIFDSCSIDIGAKAYTFRANGQTLKFNGFLAVYPIKFEEIELPNLKRDDILELKELLSGQHFTQPPSRYSEATLIKVLEKEGIGRPSTYAPTLGTIQQRNYTEKDENKKLKPTQIGIMVDDMLLANFPQIVDIQFTAKMEEEFDEVALGKDTFQKTLKDFYMPFEKILKEKEKTVEKLDLTEKTDKICPECKNPMVLRLGRYGKFFACSKFPECKHTEPLPKPTLNIECPKCGQGQITEKTTKTKKIFYGCSIWPKCDFALWDKPVNEFCGDCHSIMIETKSKAIKCPSKTCPSIINAKENKKLKKET